jgi:pteridine reductase
VAVHYNASEDGARETVDAIRAAGGEARAFGADFRAADAPARLVREAAEAFGGLDILVNSASVFHRAPVGRVTTAEWDTMVAVNLRAPYFATQAAVAAMGAAGGVVVNLADHLIYEPGPHFVPHGITKAGIVQMTQSLAPLLAPLVRINAVAPGVVLPPDDATEAQLERLQRTTPLRRIGSPDDVVAAVAYLIEADYVTGETLVVDGGRRVRGAPTTLAY